MFDWFKKEIKEVTSKVTAPSPAVAPTTSITIKSSISDAKIKDLAKEYYCIDRVEHIISVVRAIEKYLK